jgi:hypothetical protein
MEGGFKFARRRLPLLREEREMRNDPHLPPTLDERKAKIV